jgi:hypothetical protein
VDGVVDDGADKLFAVKGREIEAAVLFADIAGFSAKTAGLTPTETLIFVNHFFCWITAEALEGAAAVIDKYIGDAVMLVFSPELGSADPFGDALRTAGRIAHYDPFGFCPHIGIASGPVVVGFVGTERKYNCSVFGRPVTLAARCAGVKPRTADTDAGYMAFPAAEWGNRVFEVMFPLKRYGRSDGLHAFEMLPVQQEDLKNVGTTDVICVVRTASWFPSTLPEERAKAAANNLRASGHYRPRGPRWLMGATDDNQ